MRTAALTALLSCAASSAWAHHPNFTTRSSSQVMGLGMGPIRLDRARLEVQVGSAMSYFGRLREDTTDRDPRGDLYVATLVPTVRGVWATGTMAQVELPVGFVRIQRDGLPQETTFGIGDVTASATQLLNRLWSSTPEPVAIYLRAGFVAPSGRYEPGAAMSVTRVRPGAQGALDFATYDTQASLGAGVLSGQAAVDLSWAVGRWLQVLSTVALTEPLTRTSDDIRWGRDVNVRLGASVEPWTETLAAFAGVDYGWHDADSVPDEILGRTDVGGRHEVGVAAGLSVRFADNWSCAGQFHLPVWQRVVGVQLVETVSVQATCGYAFGL